MAYVIDTSDTVANMNTKRSKQDISNVAGIDNNNLMEHDRVVGHRKYE